MKDPLGREILHSSVVTYVVQGYMALFFLYPLALSRQGVDLVRTGWLMSGFFLATTLVRPLGSLCAERLGVRRTLLLSGLGMGVASLGLVLPWGFPGILASRLLQGACYGVFMVGLTAYQALVIPPDIRGAAFALVSVGYVMPQITVVPGADFLLSRGWLGAYLMQAPLWGFACAASAFLVPPGLARGRRSDEAWGSWKDLRGLRGLWPLLGSLLLFALVNATALQYLPSLSGEKGLSASRFIVGIALAALGVRLGGRRLMDSCPKRMTLMGGSVLLMGGMGLAALGAGSDGILLVCGLLYGVGMGFGFPVVLALIPDLIPPNLRPKGVALAFFAMDGGWILAPLLVGLLGKGLGLAGAIAPLMGAGLAGGGAIWWFGWRPLCRVLEEERRSGT